MVRFVMMRSLMVGWRLTRPLLWSIRPLLMQLFPSRFLFPSLPFLSFPLLPVLIVIQFLGRRLRRWRGGRCGDITSRHRLTSSFTFIFFIK